MWGKRGQGPISAVAELGPVDDAEVAASRRGPWVGEPTGSAFGPRGVEAQHQPERALSVSAFRHKTLPPCLFIGVGGDGRLT